MTVKKIYLKAPTGTGATTILDFDGLQLIASCIGGAASLEARSTVDNSDARVMFGTTAGDVVHMTGSSAFNSGSTFDAMAGTPRGTGVLVDNRPDGGSVTVNFGVDDTASLGSFDGCVFGGVAFGS